MSGENRKRIFEMLINESRKPDVGLAAVKEACNMFLRLGMRALVEPEKRQPVPRSWTVDLWRKQNGICARCKDPQPMKIEEATFDHIIPITEGGLHSKSNGRVLHRSCNSSKGANDMFTESKLTGQMFSEIFPEEELIDG